MTIEPRTIVLDVEPEDAWREMLARGLTDGLPVVAPTRERVERMLEGLERDPDEELGAIPPRRAPLTIRLTAVNAVMAGCDAIHLPLVIRALEAMLDPAFNLNGLQTTTHPVGPCLFFSGPVAVQAGVHGGPGCLGPGFQANAVIGRAVHLVLRNVGGAVPGRTDAATMGTPAKRTFCFTDATDSPWPSLAEATTGDPTASTVTVVPSECPQNVNDHYSSTGFGVLQMVAMSLAGLGPNDPYYPDSTPMVVLGSEHARTVAGDSYTREDAAAFIAEHARTQLAQWSPENQRGRFREKWPLLYGAASELVTIPSVTSADHVILVVAGGVGKHSMIIPTVGIGRGVTVAF